jgi:hypothetical protein
MAVAFVTSLFGTGFSIIFIIALALFSSSGAKSLLTSQMEEYLDVKLAAEISGTRAKQEEQEHEKSTRITDTIGESADGFKAAINDFSGAINTLTNFNVALSANVANIGESASLIGDTMGRTAEMLYENGIKINHFTEELKAMREEISRDGKRFESLIPVLAELKAVTEDSRRERESFLKAIYEIPDRLLNYHEAAVASADRRQVKG